MVVRNNKLFAVYTRRVAVGVALTSQYLIARKNIVKRP